MSRLQNPEYRTAIHRCLSHSRRRYTLQRLDETETPLALVELAEDIAAREAESSQPDQTSETLRDVRMMLHHVHLPALAEIDLVRYDQEQEEVELSDCPEELFDSDRGLTAL